MGDGSDCLFIRPAEAAAPRCGGTAPAPRDPHMGRGLPGARVGDGGMTKPYQLLPSLDPDAYLALKRDIEAHGIQVPVEVDEEGNVLDGHHRIRIAQELGLPDEAIPKVVRAGLTEEQKLEHVLRLNLLRRHLTREQKQALALELRQRGWSTRRIASILGVDHSTVALWVRDEGVSKIRHVDAEAPSQPLPTTITDTLGRSQPATKPRRTNGSKRQADSPQAASQAPASQAAPGFVTDRTMPRAEERTDVPEEGVNTPTGAQAEPAQAAELPRPTTTPHSPPPEPPTASEPAPPDDQGADEWLERFGPPPPLDPDTQALLEKLRADAPHKERKRANYGLVERFYTALGTFTAELVNRGPEQTIADWVEYASYYSYPGRAKRFVEMLEWVAKLVRPHVGTPEGSVKS